jgi:16S rRNA A1518/A1519 N6-dimethyltransferase RsmA/KsgA/DIM1 with predicted DNA glycosylase/AP lyase activity
LEIGTGRGTLTKKLAGLGKSLVGYEVDRWNFAATLRVVRGTKARIILGDVFDENPEFDVLVSSLPYSESATFVQWLSGIVFDRAIVLMQEDFVKKITTSPGSRDYRGISALAQLCFEVRVLGRVKRASFSPQPRVNSVMASFVPRLRIAKAEASRIMCLFSLRRRLADSALADLGMKWGGSFGQRRVYSLRPEEVHLLCVPTGQ